MKAFDQRIDPLRPHPQLMRSKLAAGSRFGAIVGLAFALVSWGLDGYLLSQTHVFLPWLKLIVGMICCSAAGGLAGFITARAENALVSLSAWFASGVFLAWLTTSLPLQLMPILSAWFRPPLKDVLTYSSMEELSTRFWIALIWILLFVV